MSNKNKRCVAVILSAVALGGCTYLYNAQPVSGDDAVSLDSKICRTYGFRNWSLQRGEEAITLSAEASMPTPAWSVMLHQSVDVDNGAIELVMETIEPPGLSSSVVSWVYFEKIIDTNKSAQADVTVKCADDVVWTSLNG